MARIPEHLIDRVRDSSDIVDLISRYVSLKKSGKNYKGLCPFHTEKTPSFMVSPEKQIFHCFGCHAGGNVFTFLMKYEKISFIEAVQKLADEAGIELPKYQEDQQQLSESDRLYRANQFAADFYHEQLQKHVRQLTSYLEKRKIKEETIRFFKIGYVPEAWDSLVKEVERKKLDINLFRKIGLILQSEKDPSRLYDRFRNRLIFPIQNLSGRVVAFGGRSLSADPQIPKYINSPESPIYRKSQILYGLYYAKEWIRKEEYAIFVEGYMDYLQLFQSGIRQVVATSGTALTEDHAKLIKRYTGKVVLCYDADQAGINAALRGGQILFQENLDVRVLLLPKGEDPDSFVREKGPSAFYALLKSAPDYFDFKTDHLVGTLAENDVSGQTRVVNELLDSLAAHSDPLKQNFYANRLAERFRLLETTLLNEIKIRQKKLQKRESFRQTREPSSATTPPVQLRGLTGAWSAERDLIIILSNYYSSLGSVIFEMVEPDEFLNENFRRIFMFLKQQGGSDAVENAIHQALALVADEQTSSMITEHLFEEIANPEKYLYDCLERIKIAYHQSRIDLLRQKIKNIPPDDPQFRESLHEINSHLARIQEIRKIFSEATEAGK